MQTTHETLIEQADRLWCLLAMERSAWPARSAMYRRLDQLCKKADRRHARRLKRKLDAE